MSDARILIGQFIGRRTAAPDSPTSPLAPGGVIDPTKSFSEVDLRDELTPDIPGARSIPARGPVVPELTLSSPAAVWDPADVSVEPSRKVASPIDVGHGRDSTPAKEQLPHVTPPPTLVAGQQPSLPLDNPSVLPGPPSVILGGPAILPDTPSFSPGSPAIMPSIPAVALGSPSTLPGPPAFAPTDPAPTFTPAFFGEGPRPRAPGGVLDPSQDAQRAIHLADARISGMLALFGAEYAPSVGAGQGIVGGPGTLALDPRLYVNSLTRLGHQLGVSGLAAFALEQAGLFALNSHGRVWNPILMVPPPILQSMMAPTLDGPGPSRDIHAEMARGTYNVDNATAGPPFFEAQAGIGGGPVPSGPRLVGAVSQDAAIVDDPSSAVGPLVAAGLSERNKYTPDVPYSENAVPLISDLVAGALGTSRERGAVMLTDGPEGMKVLLSSVRDGERLSIMFNPDKNSLSGRNEWRPRAGIAADIGAPVGQLSALNASAFPRGIIPARIAGENDFGFISHRRGESPSDIISDDVAYVPLSFTDLRPVRNTYRTVYFRPFITNLSEDFSPAWNKGEYFGRVDPVATYTATGRAVNLGFTLNAFGPEDLATIYQKLHWLTSMVYPEYDSDLSFRAGPVVRMRVGDVINAIGPEGGRGLPGIITSLSYNYDESPWELQRDMKVPRNVRVGITFDVLHDRPIGRGAEGRFGGIGSHDDKGLYLPPTVGAARQTGEETGPEVSRGGESFRLVGGPRADGLVNYPNDRMDALVKRR